MKVTKNFKIRAPTCKKSIRFVDHKKKSKSDKVGRKEKHKKKAE